MFYWTIICNYKRITLNPSRYTNSLLEIIFDTIIEYSSRLSAQGKE